MKFVCPQHKIELEVENKTLSILGKSQSVAVGKCLKCRIQYISRNIFPLCATFEVDHQTYQFLNGLHAPFKKAKILPDNTEEIKKVQSASENVITPISKEATDHQLVSSENTGVIHAKRVWYELSIPNTCPNDNSPLVHVDNVSYTVNGNPYTASGPYCRHCQTLFQVPASTATTSPKAKTADTTKKASNPSKKVDTSTQKLPELIASKLGTPKNQPVATTSSPKTKAQPSAKASKVTSGKKKKVEKKQADKYFDRVSNYTLQSITNSTKKSREAAERVAESARQGAALRQASAESANRPAWGRSTDNAVNKIPIIRKSSHPSEVTTVELRSKTGTLHTITIVENPQYANSLQGIFQRDCSISKDILTHIKENKPNITFMSQPCVITGYTDTKAMKTYLGKKTINSHTVQNTESKSNTVATHKAKAVAANSSWLIVSEITTVTLISESRQKHSITIVSDPAYQNSSKGVFWKNRSLSRSILEHIKNNQWDIMYEGELCSIIEYSTTSALKAYLSETRPSLDSELFATIWMYKSKTPCPQHPDEVEAVTAFIPSSQDFSEHPLNVNYCRRCRKYYINSVQFNLYAQKHGMPLVNLRSMASSGTYADYSTWQDESLLHFLGYNVNASDNIPEYARQELLAQAMDAGIVSKPNVSSFLEGLIRRSEGQVKMQIAIGKWKRDLQFVANYKIHDQRKVFGNLKIR